MYPTIEKIIEYNLLMLTVLKVKKADKAAVLSRSKIEDVLEECKRTKGDVYDKAVVLLKGLIQRHAFASGNRRTAFVATKHFLRLNKVKLFVRDNPKQARAMIGIREGFYTHEEIKGWIKNGKIKEFKR